MTTVRILKDGAGYKSFECSGHSGFAKEGEDIVCASVSSATELIVDILERFSVGFSLEIDKKRAYVKCTLKENKNDAVNAVLDGYCRYIKDVSSEYPDYLKCILTEV
ncbi:MAG: ribosomal-processing cysteine protease Prp [Clostridia bacterium]|nr:ribosomal-processing cysteine protease Prp [Clostridia bacterium]